LPDGTDRKKPDSTRKNAKNKVKLFFTVFFRELKTAVLSRVRVEGTRTSDKKDVFSTRIKNKVEKRISFFIGHEVLFSETAFSASALEQITLQQTAD
jgi:hypothetical protein